MIIRGQGGGVPGVIEFQVRSIRFGNPVLSVFLFTNP